MLDNWIAETKAPVPSEPNPDFDKDFYLKKLQKEK
jgi:hypothetical protein